MSIGMTLLLWVACLLAPTAAWANERPTVLVVYANNRLLPANVEFDRGVHEGMAESADRQADLFAEFLDQPVFSGPAYEAQTAAYFRAKYAARPPQVIVAVGEPSLLFVLRHRSELFPGVPVIHAAMSRACLEANGRLPPDVVGSPAAYDLPGTVDLALQLHPDAKRLIVVTGAGSWDADREKELRAPVGSQRVKAAVEFLAGLPSDKLLARLRQTQHGDVIVSPGFFTDGAGRAFTPREAVTMMAQLAGAPIYAPFDTFIGTGVVGGRMPRFSEMGRTAGRTVASILRGVQPASDLLEPTPSRVQIDWRQLQRWNIDPALIPRDAVVLFREPTVWERYRTATMLVAAIILIEGFLVGLLLLERARRRRTAAALVESRQRISLAASAARLSTWVWDLARDRVAPIAALRERGSAPDEIPVRFENVLQTVHPADRARVDQAVRNAARTTAELDVEYRIVDPDGNVRWHAVRGRAAVDAEHFLTGISMDITARKTAELQAAKDRGALAHMSRVSVLGQLSAAIAHQLNQPLAAIMGNAETARKMLGRDPVDLVELREILDDIVGEDARAAGIIRNLGALYKRGEMELSDIDVNGLVRETLELVRVELMSRLVVTHVELQPSLPAITGGRIQLQQVLLNLIINAADAMRDVEPARRTVVVRTSTEGERVKVCVTDSGTGIAEENLDSVFDAFWSTKASGVGVGLAICRSIILAHRGTLTAANNADYGATFCFTLPAPAAVAAAAP